MGDAGEGLVDAESRVQERMEELERERAEKRAIHLADPAMAGALESLRLARAELARPLVVTSHPQRRAMLEQAIVEIDQRRTAVLAPEPAPAGRAKKK
jgi:beta-phosphoglucomutase-like phosphatase (HAD superfamily)